MRQVRGSFHYVLQSLEPEVLLVGDHRTVPAFERAGNEARAIASGNATPGVFETRLLNGRIVVFRLDSPGRAEAVLAQRLDRDIESGLDQSPWM